METVKRYFNRWLGEKEPRKKEHGTLDNWRKRSQIGSRPGRRTGHKVRPAVATRTRHPGKSLRPKRPPTGIWSVIKGVFSNEDQDLRVMKNAYADFKLRGHDYGMQTRSQVQRRIANSAALKRKLLEKQYEDRLLDELRRGRKTRVSPAIGASNANINTDQTLILQHKLDSATSRLAETERELYLTQKRLKFTEEKVVLLENLLSDANIDDDYLKSRRRITNLQKDNLKPEYDALPPSPHRALSPLVTSSPRRHNPPRDDFYDKYPRIPDAELLKRDTESSLSPIRVDLSKYSGSRKP